MESITRVDSILKNASYSKRVGFITVLIEEIERDEAYEIYTATEKGKHFIDYANSFQEAQLIAGNEEQCIIERMARKRKGKPTMRQLATLFDMKIPIPVTLKFGEASDLIEKRIEEKREQKRQKIQLVGVK